MVLDHWQPENMLPENRLIVLFNLHLLSPPQYVCSLTAHAWYPAFPGGVHATLSIHAVEAWQANETCRMLGSTEDLAHLQHRCQHILQNTGFLHFLFYHVTYVPHNLSCEECLSGSWPKQRPSCTIAHLHGMDSFLDIVLNRLHIWPVMSFVFRECR